MEGPWLCSKNLASQSLRNDGGGDDEGDDSGGWWGCHFMGLCREQAWQRESSVWKLATTLLLLVLLSLALFPALAYLKEDVWGGRGRRQRVQR